VAVLVMEEQDTLAAILRMPQRRGYEGIITKPGSRTCGTRPGFELIVETSPTKRSGSVYVALTRHALRSATLRGRMVVNQENISKQRTGRLTLIVTPVPIPRFADLFFLQLRPSTACLPRCDHQDLPRSGKSHGVTN